MEYTEWTIRKISTSEHSGFEKLHSKSTKY